MANLFGFEGFLNASTPFSPKEYKVLYKSNVTYHDFSYSNNYKEQCDYPRFWNESGLPVIPEVDDEIGNLVGCYDSEFDQYGDTEAFGVFPDWQRQLSKFASVQDRLREWVPSVREKIQQFSCITISMLDIDGFRFDKALQVTVDAQAEFADFIRQCAAKYDKDNFFMPGEITGGNNLGAIYIGRGRQPDQVPGKENFTEAVLLKYGADSDKYFLREEGKSALDGAAFHYSLYRSLTRFLGMDGNTTAGFDVPVNFVENWNTLLTTNDFINVNTGDFDPRHMYGATNQDVFRWPSIRQGTEKMLLAIFIATLHMPGIPLLLWGEEQASFLLDSTASNYVFGRAPLSSALAWQDHGCYSLGSTQYHDFPIDAGARGCQDDAASLDHRDPSHPVRNIIKSMYHMRAEIPVLNDGFFLQSLSNQTRQVFLPGSNGTVTETGMWSVLRNQIRGVQKLSPSQAVWLVFQNENQTVKYNFDCSSEDGKALISPFDAGTTVKNLFAPYEEIKLGTSKVSLGIDLSEEFNGCLSSLELAPFAFKAFVPVASFVEPVPMVTKFVPGHDARIISNAGADANGTVDFEIEFSQEMDCAEVKKSLLVASTNEIGQVATIDFEGATCGNIANPEAPFLVGGIPSAWSFKAKLVNVADGIHQITVKDAPTETGNTTTASTDHFLLRVGKEDNPIVFPRTANYSQEVLFKDKSKGFYVTHKAAGADKWRYSLNWGSSWSDWEDYKGGESSLAEQPWSGTKRQEWKGDHVVLQYWGRLVGSSSHVQHADIASKKQAPRRFPHLFSHGSFNQFGFDGGLKNTFELDSDSKWNWHFMTEWPAEVQLNVWGINPDGKPDSSFVYGDIDNDTVLDRALPDALAPIVVNFTQLPPSPHIAYRMVVDDSTARYSFIPVGSRSQQVLIFGLLWTIPILTGLISTWAYIGAFYGVKFNKIGISQKKGLLPVFFRSKFEKLNDRDEEEVEMRSSNRLSKYKPSSTPVLPAISLNDEKRRTVLIATMEYDIEDWAIKIKIGGLGVMAQLMGKSLQHQDLVWVVPCVGGIDYPVDQVAEPMFVTILGALYEIQVQYHVLRNITYVLLDAPIFRQQTKTEPYPPRMDDLDSAVYYSAWNACK
ncbi:alpha-1,3-glucan synthase [Phlyctema vagabunda]|uniref:Alpha-1,3-glucan synthase n=1 Tax=Phlyctema vagabunda TaxID=108571 RepID=A0ABR4PMJ7_9HELO